MAILNNNPLIGSGGNQGYNINNSLRFRSSASTYLNRTPASAGNRRTWTWSAWVKRGTLTTAEGLYLFEGTPGSGKENPIVFGEGGSSDKFSFYGWNGSGFDFNLKTTQVFRDISAWYHLVVAVDTTQATSSNRVKIYVNGNQISAFDASTYPSQNYDMAINNNIAHRIGTGVEASSRYFDGYMADINFIDGSQKAASDFGETDTTTGVWKPKAYSGTYGTNGFYLKFSDIATTSGSNAGLGKDFSGNTNYWTTNNISVTSGTTYDAMTDSPTNTSATVANYATLNPNLRQTGTGQAPTSANLKLTANTTGYSQVCCATIASPSGKFYWEVTVNGGVGTIGIADSNNSAFTSVVCSTSATTSDPNEYTWGWSVNLGSGNKKHNNVSTSYGSAASSGDVYMCAVDIDNSKVWWGKNGTWFASGSPTAGTNAAYTNVSGNIIPYLSPTDGSGYTNDINFGQRPFSYTPPTGFVALNTYNLPTPTILQGNKYMDATLYTGNGTSQTITNAGGFRPDLVWYKNRSTTNFNGFQDSVRGITNELYSNSTLAEQTSQIGTLSSFNSNGFSVGSAAGTNGNGNNLVGWQWQAGQGSTSSNTSGSITSTVSVNTTAGFSVVTYTGTGANATVGHGLGVAPKMVIVKARNSAGWLWCVYHASVGATGFLRLNATDATTTSSTAWQNTAPTSTVFSIGTEGAVNYNSSTTYVAYCWAEIAGFSKFGSFDGNGSTDNAFVYLGFRPKYLLLKLSSGIADWIVMDTSRNTYNVANARLYPSADYSEDTGGAIDFLSNGFKIRQTFSGTYIYTAFAENPFKNALAR